MNVVLQQRLAAASPVTSRLWHLGSKNTKSMRCASRPRQMRSTEERDLNITLENTAVSAPFAVAGSQRLSEPLKLFLACAKAAAQAKAGQESSGVNDVRYFEIGAGGLQEDALQALLQVGFRGAQGRLLNPPWSAPVPARSVSWSRPPGAWSLPPHCCMDKSHQSKDYNVP